MILNVIISILIFLFLPIILGFGLLKFKDDNKSVFLAFVLGFLIQWLVFEFFAIPMTFIGCSFNTLRKTWTTMMIILAIVSILVNKSDWKEIISINIQDLKKNPKILGILTIILIFFQGYMSFTYMYEDYDDSNFVAKGTIALATNTLFKYDDIGNVYTQLPSRYVFSPFPYYTATVAAIVKVHPAIMAHTILPVVMLLICYSIYYLIGLALFKNNKNKTFTFLILLSVSYIFGAYTRYSVYLRILARAWQGKSGIANIILPFIWYIYFKYIGEKNDGFYLFVLFITLWAAVLLSSMALTLPIIAAGLLTVIYMIKDKKINYIFKLFLCCIPSIIYGLIYLQIK